MPIKRTSDQSQTLEQYYSEMLASENQLQQWKGRDMLAFIEVVNQTFVETQLYGLTSIDRLIIQAENSWKSDWYVIVSAVAGEYYFEYLMPKSKAPWENALVRGTAKSLQETRRYLIVSMKESEGWKGNFELEKLVATFS